MGRLRYTEASLYTQRDTPMFTCVKVCIEGSSRSSRTRIRLLACRGRTIESQGVNSRTTHGCPATARRFPAQRSRVSVDQPLSSVARSWHEGSPTPVARRGVR